MINVPVELSDRSYQVHVGTGLFDGIGSMIAELVRGRRAFIVTDEHVAPLFAARLESSLNTTDFHTNLAILPPGESTKSLKNASQLYDRLIDWPADRHTLVIALGGGVIGDLAGFAAATFARGLPFVQIPTTLLAMVDASVGGKVAVDHPKAKNMIGAFHQPRAVFCDIDLLATLPDREFRCGLAEVVKYGVIMDDEFFTLIEDSAEKISSRDPQLVEAIVARSCELKAHVVKNDEFETLGLRAILNYGHTFAHAFETASHYGDLQHGEAVAIGMICAGRLAERLGKVDASLNDRQESLWRRLGLPTRLPANFNPSELVSIMRRDKKAVRGLPRFILPTRIGQVELVSDVPESLVLEVMDSVTIG